MYFFLQCEFFQWEFILLLLHSLVHCLAHTRFSVNTKVPVTQPSKIPSTIMVYDFILMVDFNINSNTRGQLLSNQCLSQTFHLYSLPNFGSRLKIRDYLVQREESKAYNLQSCNIVGKVMVTSK